MDESILDSVKKLNGIDSSYDVFDEDMIIHINSVFMRLHQLGVGPTSTFAITGSTEKWSDFIGSRGDINAVKTYVALKVRMIFDPPTTASVIDALNATIRELEWTLNVQVDPKEGNELRDE